MVIKRDKLGEYYGVQGTTWKDPPLLEGGFDKVKAGRRTFELHYDGDRVKLVAWRTPKAVYWVSNTLLQSSPRSRCWPSPGPRGCRRRPRCRATLRFAMSRQGTHRRDRRRLGRPVHGGLLRRAGPRGRSARHPAREGGVALAGRGHRSTSPGLPELLAKNARAAALHHRHGRGAGQRPAAVLLRGHAAHLLGRRRPLARGGRDRRAGRLDRARDRDEEHGAGGHRPLDPPPPGGPGLRLQPRVPQGGLGGQGLHAARPRGGGRRARARRASPTAWPRSTSRSSAPDRAHRRGQRRDDQAGLQRLPGHQDLLHQRDRQRVRGAGRRRERGGARHGPRRAHRRQVPARRASATAAPASPRTSPRSSSWPATRATTSSCSPR